MHHYSAYDSRDVADARVFSKIKRRRLETRPIELNIHHARARPASRVRASDSPASDSPASRRVTIARSLPTRRESLRFLLLLFRSTFSISLALSREFEPAPHPGALHLIRRARGVHDAVGRGLQGSKNRHRARVRVTSPRVRDSRVILSAARRDRDRDRDCDRARDRDRRRQKNNKNETLHSRDGDEFDVKVQRRVRRNDAAGAAPTVPELGGNDELAFPTHSHGR